MSNIMRYSPNSTTKQKMTIRYNKRCHWSHILSSPMWKNLPCNEEPAILHHCGIHEWPIARCVLQIRLWKHFVVRIIRAFKRREFRFDFAILLILQLYEYDTNILRHGSIPNTTPYKWDMFFTAQNKEKCVVILKFEDSKTFYCIPKQ